MMLFNRRLGVAGRLPVLLLVICLLLVAIPLANAAPPAQSPEDGQAIFQQKCAGCHTVGGGKLVGPDLKGVTAEREQDWLVRWLVAPDKMLAEKDPIAVKLLQAYNNVAMPNLGLSEADARSLIAFLAQAGSTEAKTTTEQEGAKSSAASTITLPTGDPDAGRALFAGTARFQNDAPACISCHTVTGIGSLGGGTMGPNLTQVLNRYGGETGMASVLSAPPFPTMKPIFDKHPLTPEEQANLIAFLKAEANQQPATSHGPQALIALIVFAIMLGAAQLVWQGRLAGVRRPLVKKGQV